MKPGAGENRRNVGRLVDIRSGWKLLTCIERRELLRVELLDHAEAAELALDPVEITMVVSVARDKAVAG